MMRVFAECDDADARGGAGPAERIGKGWTARRKRGTGNEASIQARRAGNAGIGAEGTEVCLHRERAIVLHAFIAWNFQNDAVVIDAIAAANHSAAVADGVVGEADARS